MAQIPVSSFVRRFAYLAVLAIALAIPVACARGAGGSSRSSGTSPASEALALPPSRSPDEAARLERASQLAEAPVYLAREVTTKARRRGAGSAHVSNTGDLMAGGACPVVELEYVVDSSGKVLPTTISVTRSTSPTFERAILQDLPSTRFRPAKRHGQKVAQLVEDRRALKLSGCT